MTQAAGRYVAAVGILCVTLAAARLAANIPPQPLTHPLNSIPPRLGGWMAAGETMLSDYELSILQPTTYLLRDYRPTAPGAALEVQLLVVFYDRQQVGKNMHSPKNCLPGSWEVRHSGTVDVPLPGGRPARVNTYAIQRDEQKQLILYWYESKDWLAASEYRAKFSLLRDSVLSHRSSGSLIRLDLPDQPGALESGTAFAAAVMPEIRRCLE
jgi:EpsI family protein